MSARRAFGVVLTAFGVFVGLIVSAAVWTSVARHGYLSSGDMNMIGAVAVAAGIPTCITLALINLLIRLLRGTPQS